MTTEQLQEELRREKAAHAAVKAQVAQLNEQLGLLKKEISSHSAAGALAEATNRFKELITNLQNGIFFVDEHKKIVVVNEMFCRMFGIVVPPEALIGTDGGVITAQIRGLFKSQEQYKARVDKILAEKQKVLKDELILTTGQIFSRDFIPVFIDGEYKGHLWKFTDVTRNRTIEATFESQRLFYEQILNNVPAEIIVCTPEYRYLYLNPMAVPDPAVRKWMMGKTNEEYCRQMNRPEEIAKNRRNFFDRVMKQKTQCEWEEEITGADGNTTYHLRKMYPVLDEHGQVEVLIGYGVDITERKKIEQQIRFSEKRYRDMFSFSKAWICTHDMMGKILSINPAACDMMEFPEKELLGKTIESLIPEKVRPQFQTAYMQAIKTAGKAEGIMSILNKRGKKLYLLYQNFMVREPGLQPYVIGFAQNITERVQMEEELKRSEEKYRGIIENINLGMTELDIDEHIVYANQRFCMMSGYTLDELANKKATDIFLSGANVKRVSEHISRVAYETTSSYELEVKTKSGENKWWLICATPVFNTDKTRKGTISIHLDITQQKKMEQQLREAKSFSERAARSKDIFLTNMSHEIRTPLNAIMGLGKLLSKSELDDQQKNYLAGIESASENLLGIINDLLDFSKIEAGKITLESISFNMEVVCSQLINLLSHKAEEKGLELSYEVDPQIAPVLMGDPYRINQVFTNMLSNAIKFTEKGFISLKASLQETANGTQTILVTIQDTGVGIKEEYIAHLFDKFTQEDETVVRKFGGTGLGMSITKQLMELMGGSIEVKSRKNEGTTIFLTFKLKIGMSRVLEKKRTIKNDTSNINNKRILLVEDNNLNRLLANTILKEYGAVITEAVNGREAIEHMKQAQFDIVLMDVQMPVMDGIQATQIIRKEISTSVPILALTANVIKGKVEQFLDAGMDDYIYKPYDEIKLVTPISKWLIKKPQSIEPAAAEQKEEVIEMTVSNPAPSGPATHRQERVTAPVQEPSVTPVQKTIKVHEAASAVLKEKVYDLAKLESIGRNDAVFMNKMIKLFVDEVPPTIKKIKKAFDDRDINTVTYLSHRIKPSILNMGINSIKAEILQVEAARDKPIPERALAEMIGKIDTTIDQAVLQLKAEFDLE